MGIELAHFWEHARGDQRPNTGASILFARLLSLLKLSILALAWRQSLYAPSQVVITGTVFDCSLPATEVLSSSLRGLLLDRGA